VACAAAVEAATLHQHVAAAIEQPRKHAALRQSCQRLGLRFDLASRGGASHSLEPTLQCARDGALTLATEEHRAQIVTQLERILQ